MKFLIIFIFLFTSLFSLEIDPKMHDKKEALSHLKEIEKRIYNEKNSNLKPVKISNEESYYLEKLRTALKRKIEINRVEFNTNNTENLTLQDAINKLKLHIELHSKIESQDELLNDIQNRLSFSKKQIENYTKEEKDNALLYQLQFAYFKIHKTNIETRKELLLDYKSELNEYLYFLISNLKNINIEKIEKNINLSITRLNDILQKQAEIQIEIEKSKIDENSIELKKSQEELKDIELLFQNENLKTLDLILKKIVFALNNKDEKKYITYFEQLEERVSDLNSENKKNFEELSFIINDLAKNVFGNTKVMIASSSLEFKTIYENIKNKLTGTLFIFNEQAITFVSLFKAFLFIIFGFIFGVIYKKWLLKVSSRWTNISDMSLKISSNVGYYLIIFFAFIIAISSLGIDLTSLSLIAGALSIGIGFGLQTVVSNLIAGVILMFERTIRIGDVIEINELLKGTVSDIRIRSTTIKTFDNIDIVIPNSSFIQNNVINWTLEDPTRRLHIPFGVAYGTEIQKVKDVVVKELLESNLVFIRGIEGKEPEIRMEMMNASSVDLELLVWVKTNDRLTPNALKSDFLILIYNALYKHNIEIPFPQMDVHIDKK